MVRVRQGATFYKSVQKYPHYESATPSWVLDFQVRQQKKESATVALFFSAAVYAVLYFIHTDNVMLFLPMAFLASLGMNYFNVVIWAFITDIIDYQEVKTGSADSGTVYAVYSFSRKLGQALAGGLGGFALAAIGYASAAATQEASRS
jgi:GPH family glycoside/pentoside/hexuronide:cation symporter